MVPVKQLLVQVREILHDSVSFSSHWVSYIWGSSGVNLWQGLLFTSSSKLTGLLIFKRHCILFFWEKKRNNSMLGKCNFVNAPCSKVGLCSFLHVIHCLTLGHQVVQNVFIPATKRISALESTDTDIHISHKNEDCVISLTGKCLSSVDKDINSPHYCK